MFTQLAGLRSVQDLSAKLDPTMFVVALLFSLAAALAASVMYTRFCERRSAGSQIHRAFPLLAISVTTLFICVQISLPLSLGLLGALSIIRFRTPVKEPEETGFIMLVIAAAITCATFNFQFLVILYLLAGLTLYGLSRRRRKETGDGLLVLVLRDAEAVRRQPEIEACLRRSARRSTLESATSKEGQTSLQFSFAGLKGSVSDLQDQLRQQGDAAAINVFFNRPA